MKMFELKNPDWTKTDEEREKFRELNFDIWFNVEHQYPYQSRTKRVRRVWINPFYIKQEDWYRFWLRWELIEILSRRIVCSEEKIRGETNKKSSFPVEATKQKETHI